MTKTITKRRSLTMLRTLASTVILLLLLGTNLLYGQSTANYTFSTSTSGSLALDANGNTVDMSTGATALVATGVDEGASVVNNIGFNFTLMGVTYTQFSASSNGVMQLGSTAVGTATYIASGGTVASPRIAAWGSDATTTTNGVRSKVIGTSPNRCLVIENNAFLNYQSTINPCQFQIRLYESTGVIEFVYGSMTAGTIVSAGSIGFSVGTATNTLASITNSTNAVSLTTFAANTPTASVAVTNLNSASNGSRRVYTFTPPAATAASNLAISNIGAGGMTLNWTAGTTANHLVYRSLDNVTYTLVATLPIATTNYVATGLNPNTLYYWNVVATSEGSASAAVNASATTSTPTLSGTKTVCPSGCDYANLTTATADLASQGLLGPVVLELAPSYVSSTETFPITFSNFPGLNATNTLRVTVNSGATALSIANTATTGTAQTIDMNGTSYVTIDGRPGSTGTTSQLSISSANPGIQTIRYINGANNNTLTYATVTGVNVSTTLYGVIAFLGTTGTTTASGNRFNTISYCNIGAGATAPLKGIFSAGQSATILNDFNNVLNCNFIDIFNVTAASTQNCLAIDLSGTNNSDWTITSNSFYLTTARASTAGSILHIGVFTGGGNGYNISNNYFGGTGPLCTGTWTVNGTATAYRYNAIQVNGGTLRTSNIQGNTISGFDIVSTSTGSTTNPVLAGILVSAGNVNIGNITPNIIGSSSAVDNMIVRNTASITTNGAGVAGIGCTSTGIINIQNNVMGGMTCASASATIAGNVCGIYNTGGTGRKVISGNTIGGSFSNSFRAGTSGLSTTGASAVSGIANTGTPVIVMSGNTLSNYVAYGTTGVTAIRGITTSAGTDTIANNTFSNFSTNGAGSVMGIASSATTAAIDITRNSMNNFTVVNASGSARGIQISAALATPRVAYNFIQGISAPSSNGNAMIMGIDIGHAVAQNIYNNTVVLGTSSTPLTGVTNFGVIGISYNTGTTDLRNNIIYVNATAAGTGINAALRRATTGTNGTAPANFANTSNNNVYYVPQADFNFIYTEGTTANRTTVVNSYHNCASCTNTGVTTAPVVDVNFNNSCSRYKAFLGASSSRGASSFYENVTFTGGSTIPNNLIPAPTGVTFLLNAGQTGTGLTTDYFGNAVSSTTPDIGAAEFNSGSTVDATAPNITFTAIPATACASNPTLTATITDASGVDFATNPPRVYYRYSTDAVTGLASANNNTVGGWKFVTASSQVGNNFNFTLDYSLLNTTVAAATVIQYFVVAQDLASTPNVKLATVGLASGFCPASVALASGAFPIVASPTVSSYTISAAPTITLTTVKTENCTGGAALTLSGSDGRASYDWQRSTFSNPTWTSYSPQPTMVTSTSYITGALNATTNNNDIVRLVATCPGAGAPLFTSTQDTIKNLVDCQFTVARSTGNTYSSIMTTGNTYTALTSADDSKTNNISLLGTTFKYRGAVVRGFYATTNGWMTFDTTQTSNTYTNDLTTLRWVIAPFWDDLVLKGNSLTNQNICMRYQVIGTLGSGTADIVIEWAEMERFLFPAPNLNFQVVLHELDNSIDINYGNMQLFDGSSTTGVFTYSVGLNGNTSSTVSLDQRMLQQNTNTNFFTSAQQQNLAISPDCYSRLRFVPASTYSGTAPTIGAPANNEPGTATTLTVNPTPCTLFCGNIYTSLNATATSGVTACSATTPGVADDDVYFSFTTTVAPQYQITVTPSLSYDAVVQILNSSMTPVACINAGGQGIQETVAALALTSGTYYVRVYDAATGASGSGEFAICVSEVIPPPSNDNVSGATNLTVGTTCVPTNSPLPNILAATASPQSACSGTADDDVWYKFTATSSGINVTVNGVSTYNPVMQIFSDSGITQIACQNNTGNGGQETYSATNFTAGQVYYVRVYHAGNGVANGNFNICVFANVPTCTTKISPASGASLISGASLSWNAATYAAGYDVYLDIVNPPVTLVSANQVATSYATSGLNGSTVYYWMVVPKNAAGAASGCTVDSFSTNPPPIIPLPTSPTVGSTTRVASNLVLSWPASPGAAGYDVYFNNGTSANNLVSASQTALTYTVTSISAPDVYAWKVVPFNANGYAIGAIDWIFYDSLPSGPSTPITPVIGSTTTRDSAVVLSWLTVNGATGYDVYLDAGTGTASNIVSINQPGTTYTTSSIGVGSYTWRVVPKNANGGVSSPDWSFTVDLPSCITNPTAPTNNSVQCLTTLRPLSWTAVAGARGYNVYINGTLVSTQTGTSYSITGATAGSYTWKVEPFNNNGTPSGCSTWNYSITFPSLASTTPATRCGAGSVTVSATPSVPTDSIVWYSAMSGGQPLAYGQNYTATVNGDSNFYVAEMDPTSFSIQNGLGLDVSGTTVAAMGTGFTAQRGIVFTATSDFTLNTAQYYSLTTSVTNTVTVTLVNHVTGATLQTLSLPVVQGATAGWYTMNLNLNISAGVTYRLLASFSQVVSRYATGANYASAQFNNLGTFGTITSGYDGAVNATSYNYFHNISATGTGCFGNRQAVAVTVNPSTAISAGTGTTICQGGTGTTLNASSSDPTFVYTWSPSTGLSTTSGASPVANPSSTTLYTARGTNSVGCISTDTVRVRVSLAPSTPVVAPSAPAICAGVSLPLEIQAGAIITLGTATTTTAGMGITPYSAFYEGSREQYLITAAELNAMGFSGAGNISALSFNVTTTSAYNQTDFKISMGLTSATSMTGYVTPIGGSLTPVYGPVLLTPPPVGLNKYTFNSPFAWDGVSNIVVDVCHDNDINNTCAICYGTSGTVAASTTAFLSTFGSYSDNVQSCGVQAAITANGSVRPDMVFDFVGNSGAVWTSNTSPLNLYLDSAATNPYAGTVETKVYVKAFATQTYTVTATNAASCSSSSNVTVTINTAPSAPSNFAISNVTSTSFDLNWNATTNTSDYLVDVSSDPAFSTFVSGYNGLSLFTTSASVAGLTPGTVYYARVRARNSCFSSSNSSASVLMRPSAPINLFANSVTSSGYTANWTGSFGATSYLLDVSTNITFSSFVSGYSGLSVSGSNQAVSGLSQGTKYFYRLRSVNATGNSAFSLIDSVTTGTNTVSISLKAYLQGLYTGSGTMIAAPFAANGVTSMLIADTITVQLNNAATGALAYTATATLSTTGIANVTFPGGAIGNNYYITIKHRNSIATATLAGMTIGATGNSYDFSVGSNLVFGSNVVDDGTGKFMIYTGDINQDGSVDFNDYPDLDIASSNGVLGYDPNDLNGDASVDFNDYPLIDVNSSNGVIAILPY